MCRREWDSERLQSHDRPPARSNRMDNVKWQTDIQTHSNTHTYTQYSHSNWVAFSFKPISMFQQWFDDDAVTLAYGQKNIILALSFCVIIITILIIIFFAFVATLALLHSAYYTVHLMPFPPDRPPARARALTIASSPAHYYYYNNNSLFKWSDGNWHCYLNKTLCEMVSFVFVQKSI